MTEPTTAAGRALLSAQRDHSVWTVDGALSQLVAAIEAESALPSDWAQWIVREDDERHHADNACAQCVPDGPILIEGFRCVPHEARAALGMGSFTAPVARLSTPEPDR